jgi:hypothetical protein
LNSRREKMRWREVVQATSKPHDPYEKRNRPSNKKQKKYYDAGRCEPVGRGLTGPNLRAGSVDRPGCRISYSAPRVSNRVSIYIYIFIMETILLSMTE